MTKKRLCSCLCHESGPPDLHVGSGKCPCNKPASTSYLKAVPMEEMTIPLVMLVDGARKSVGAVRIRKSDYSVIKAGLHPSYSERLLEDLKVGLIIYEKGMR